VEKKFVIDYFLGDLKVNIDPTNDVERRLLSGAYETDTEAMIGRFVREGHVAVDIGANVGAVSLALAKAVGEMGRVEAFEPGPMFFSRLEANLELNPGLKKRVRTHRIGLSATRGALVWQPSVSISGTASTYIGQIDSRNPVIEVPAHPFDSFAKDQGIERVDFIKIDVDGGELEVLKGAQEYLRKQHPVIYVEVNFWDEATTARAAELDQLLRSLGYSIYKLLPQTHELVATRFPDYSFNVIAMANPNA
jgi:FkbM family methyltransferase